MNLLDNSYGTCGTQWWIDHTVESQLCRSGQNLSPMQTEFGGDLAPDYIFEQFRDFSCETEIATNKSLVPRQYLESLLFDLAVGRGGGTAPP